LNDKNLPNGPKRGASVVVGLSLLVGTGLLFTIVGPEFVFALKLFRLYCDTFDVAVVERNVDDFIIAGVIGVVLELVVIVLGITDVIEGVEGC
jgi:hypothetical protein